MTDRIDSKTLSRMRRVLNRYDPNQPRDPKGTSTGGQWAGTGGANKGEEITDWQGRTRTRDVIRGGNLTKDEANIIDLSRRSPLSRFRGKDVDSKALDTFKGAGFVRALPKFAKSYDTYYELTIKGREILEQYIRVRHKEGLE